MRAAAVLPVAAAALALGARPGVAHAELEIVARSYVALGRLESEARAHPDGAPATDYGGFTLTAGTEVFAPTHATRFGAPFGLHLRLDALFATPGLWQRDGRATPETPPLVFFDVEGEAGVGVAPIYRPRFGLILTFDGLAGTTRRGVQASARSSLGLGRSRLELDVAVRTGHTWNGTPWREQRVRVGLARPSVVVGVELTAGVSADARGEVDYATFAKGDYLHGQLVIAWQLR